MESEYGRRDSRALYRLRWVWLRKRYIAIVMHTRGDTASCRGEVVVYKCIVRKNEMLNEIEEENIMELRWYAAFFIFANFFSLSRWKSNTQNAENCRIKYSLYAVLSICGIVECMYRVRFRIQSTFAVQCSVGTALFDTAYSPHITSLCVWWLSVLPFILIYLLPHSFIH